MKGITNYLSTEAVLDYLYREMGVRSTVAPLPAVQEAAEVRGPLATEPREALRTVEVAEGFFEKVRQRTLYYYRCRSEGVRPFDDLMVGHLNEAESSSRRALDLIRRSMDDSVRPFDALAEYLLKYLDEQADPRKVQSLIQSSKDGQPELSTLDQFSLLKILPVHLKKELIYAVYSLEGFHNQLQLVPGYDDHKEDLRQFLDSLEPFATGQLSGEGVGKLGNRTSHQLMEHLHRKVEGDREDVVIGEVRRKVRERKRQERKPKSERQDSKDRRKTSEHLERLEQSNREILEELREAQEARDRAERREVRRDILKRHPKWWWWLP